MNYIKEFKLFEQKQLDEYDEIMGKMLRLYGSIPIPKEKSSIVIGKILESSIGRYYKLGEDIDIKIQENHNKVRFRDYFDSLINSKDSRGHNYEGTLCGLHNGELSKRGEKWDMTLNNKTWSVKFVDNPSKAIQIGSYKGEFKNKQYLEEKINHVGGLTRLFKTDETELKKEVFDIISEGITGGWIISFPYKANVKQKGRVIGDTVIRQHIITTEEMKQLFVDGLSIAPKRGLNSYYTLALSSKYKKYDNHSISDIIIPKLTLPDLKKIYQANRRWSLSVFGDFANKMRPDVLKYIKSNSKDISNKLIKYIDF